MRKNEDFRLVGHLQVMEEPLSSLYMDNISGLFYLFVRLFEETTFSTFILTEVAPHEVVDYMEGRLGLRGIFSLRDAYYYQHQSEKLHSSDFKLLSIDKTFEMLEADGLDDKFDRHLSYRMVPMKQYLKKIVYTI